MFLEKPLGGKAYGSIPHLPGSRMGPGDHHCHEGQARICTEKRRGGHDMVIIQEKLDGSCVSVAKLDGSIIPLIRAGYRAESSKYLQHRWFANWVYENYERFDRLLNNGERVCGEWLAQAHGTRYNLPHEPFVVFDIFSGGKRVPYDRFVERVEAQSFVKPYLVHKGESMSVEDALSWLNPKWHGSTDPIEGIVYRVEQRGAVDFLCKYVRPDKVDGCYLPEVSGQDPVWNWTPTNRHEEI